MKPMLRWVGWLLAIVIAAYFVVFATRTFRIADLAPLATPRVIASILAAAFLYALIIPLSALAWGALLRSQGEPLPRGLLASILAVTQLAKYVPGGVAQPLGRAAMSIRNGMSARAFATSVVQETVLAVGASVTTGVSLLLLSPAGMMQIPETYRGMVLVGVLATIGSVILFACGARLMPACIRRSRWIATLARVTGPAPGTRTTALVFLTYCLNYLTIGVGVWVVGQALALGASGGYLLLTGSFALSWLLGFVVPGAPAGLGVREGIMTILLSGSLDQHRILSLVIAIRLATLAGDGLCFVAGLWAVRSMKRELTR